MNWIRYWAGLAVLLFATASAAIAAKTETVSYASGNETVSGYLVTPDKPGRYPGIITIHEIYGLTDWIKEQSRRFGDEGYVVLAIDLFRKVPKDAGEGRQLLTNLPQDRAIRDMKAAYDYIASRK